MNRLSRRVLEMSSAKTSQAVTLAALAAVVGYAAIHLASMPHGVSAGEVPAPGKIQLDWPMILGMVATLCGGGAWASWLGKLGPILKVFEAFTTKTTNTTTVIKTDDKKTDAVHDTIEVVLELGTMGYYAGLHKSTTDAGERAKIREAASILNDKLFDSWFPMEAAK